jgi:endogenous inhibitor of DNA gyrase (YacG/DUF329 family)
MRETVRPEVKRRRRFKPAAVASVAAVPELVADKYYARKKTCRMVDLGIKVEGCKDMFTPKGNEVTCSAACRDKLERYHNKKSEKKNRHKHRAARNAAERKRRALKKGKPPGRPCQVPGCQETYYSWQPRKRFCSKRCKKKDYNRNNRDKVNASNKTYRDAHKDQFNARRRSSDRKKRDKVNARSKAWRDANKDAVNARRRDRLSRPGARKLTPEHCANISAGVIKNQAPAIEKIGQAYFCLRIFLTIDWPPLSGPGGMLV